jgi:murein DD-endopeptidase MepM/ murein hydrolase activator NlpD
MQQGPPIVPEILLRLLSSNAARRWVLAAVLPFMGVVAAFGIAPDTVIEEVEVTRVIERVVLNPVVKAREAEETYWREERVQRGDTISSVLARLGVDDADAGRFLRTSAEARPLRQLVPGRVVRAQMTDEGQLVELRYVNGGTTVLVTVEDERFLVTEQQAALERRIEMKAGEIRSSLFAAADAAQVSEGVAIQLAEIFSSDIDFHRDLRRGDRFIVVYEAFYHAGEPVRAGRVLAAEFVNQGKRYEAVWFQHSADKGDYYTLRGKSIRKAFLRSPLEFSRISSGFTHARYHPVLQRWQAHRGIDYAAPTGTPVRAVADGTVEVASRDRGYGNVVVLTHQQRYTTLYAHLSGFASGIRQGAKVSQGQIIGYVGATGLATGPHLHYEFRVDGVHKDPLTVAMPDAPPITAERLAAFEAVARPMALRLALMRDGMMLAGILE